VIRRTLLSIGTVAILSTLACECPTPYSEPIAWPEIHGRYYANFGSLGYCIELREDSTYVHWQETEDDRLHVDSGVYVFYKETGFYRLILKDFERKFRQHWDCYNSDGVVDTTRQGWGTYIHKENGQLSITYCPRRKQYYDKRDVPYYDDADVDSSM